MEQDELDKVIHNSHTMKKIIQAEIEEILMQHKLWLEDHDKGKQFNRMDDDLKRIDMSAAKMRGADLREANLFCAKLYGTDFLKADLSRANLNGAGLLKADLREARLNGADLRYADLRGADLRGADLLDADLNNADLRGADLKGAKMCQKVFDSAALTKKQRDEIIVCDQE